jgi:hypothetical protein
MALTETFSKRYRTELVNSSREKSHIRPRKVYLLTARTEDELKEAENVVSKQINYASEFGRFYAIWIRKYLKHKGIEMETHVKEGGKVMLETLVTNIRDEGIAQGMAKGKAEGELEKARKVAKKLKEMGDDPAKIAMVTDLSEDEIRAM